MQCGIRQLLRYQKQEALDLLMVNAGIIEISRRTIGFSGT